MPPLAAPTNAVIFPDGSLVAAIAEMRPLIAAEPMLRARSPEIVAELKGACSAAGATVTKMSGTKTMIFKKRMAGSVKLFWGRDWKTKQSVFYSDVGLSFFDHGLLFVG